ncbi:MAG: glycosyltransferase [Anaerolineae bacterium]|nr:glycosyltransferase [Anaerolineae bacterium]
MRLLKLTSAYPEFLRQFYVTHPELNAQSSYAEHKTALNGDLFYLCDLWTPVITPLGHDVLEITLNAEAMQRAWARENRLPPSLSLGEIAAEQARRFQPDVLLYEEHDEAELIRLREAAPSIRFTFTIVGSALFLSGVWRHLDLFVTCAPESVQRLRAQGFRAEHLDHGFDARILTHLTPNKRHIDITFIGSLVRNSQFHLEREQILERLVDLKVDLQIFSPSHNLTWRDDAKWWLRNNAYAALIWAQQRGISRAQIDRVPGLNLAAKYARQAMRPVNPKLKPLLKPAVFGLPMFQVLRNAKIALNIHADSSPTHASNGKLFETTGVGTLLVTDWRDNLPQLFTPGSEVLAYRSPDEAAELIRYYLTHDTEREAIAAAGQRRTLGNYTYAHRARQLVEIIEHNMGK